MSTEPINSVKEPLASKAVPPVLSDNPIVKKIVEETGASQMGEVAKVASVASLTCSRPSLSPSSRKSKKMRAKPRWQKMTPARVKQ